MVVGERIPTVTGEIEFLWQDTPALWMAVRPGKCWCPDCVRKNARGFGRTQEEAAKELMENEAQCDD